MQLTIKEKELIKSALEFKYYDNHGIDCTQINPNNLLTSHEEKMVGKLLLYYGWSILTIDKYNEIIAALELAIKLGNIDAIFRYAVYIENNIKTYKIKSAKTKSDNSAKSAKYMSLYFSKIQKFDKDINGAMLTHIRDRTCPNILNDCMRVYNTDPTNIISIINAFSEKYNSHIEIYNYNVSIQEDINKLEYENDCLMYSPINL